MEFAVNNTKMSLSNRGKKLYIIKKYITNTNERAYLFFASFELYYILVRDLFRNFY